MREPASRSPFGPRWRIAACALGLGVLAILPYTGGLRHAFVYDDHGQIVENPFLSSAGSWRAVLTLSTLNDPALVNGRRPLVLLSYLADHALWGMTPWGWRAHNLCLLAGAAMALYLLWVRLLHRMADARRRNAFAFFAALLFAWHPAMTEAVQVPSFRPDLMVVWFSALALHGACWVAWGRRRATRRAGLALFGCAMAAAVLSKESGAMVLLLLALAWWLMPATRPARANGVALWVIGGGVLAAYVALSLRAAQDGALPPSLQALGAEWNGRSLRTPSNWLTWPWLWAAYWRVLCWPVPLIVDRVVIPVESILALRFVLGAASVGLAGAVFVWTRRRAPWVAWGLGWMAVAFVPVSNAVPLLNPMAERYMPMLIAGFAVLAAYALAGAGFRGRGWGVTLRITALAFLLIASWVITLHRLRDFRDDETLWYRTMHDEPLSARAHTWLGLIRQRQDQWPEAIEHFGKAHVLNPWDLTALINNAILYGRLGEYAAAEAMLREAVATRPSFAPAHWNLAVALAMQERYEEALAALDETLRLDPYHGAARKQRIVLLVDQGAYASALRDVEWWLAFQPDDAEMVHARAYLLDQIENRQ